MSELHRLHFYKNKQPKLKFSYRSISVPFQWSVELQFNTDITPPTAERSDLARTSTLPSLLHVPPPGLTNGVSQRFSISLLCLPSAFRFRFRFAVRAWVILGSMSCSYAVTGTSCLWHPERRRIDQAETLAGLRCSSDAHRCTSTNTNRSDRRRRERK